jgi:hypothetical protein
VDKSKGGDDSPQNLRAICDCCNEGLQNTAPQKPDRIHLLSQIRRATIDDQEAVLGWLSKKFGRQESGSGTAISLPNSKPQKPN